MHWLDKATGALVARTSSGGKRVSNPPVVAGGLLLVINDVGHITAFRASGQHGQARPPKRAETPAAEAAPADAAAALLPLNRPPADACAGRAGPG